MTDVDAKQRTVFGECPGRDILAALTLGKLPLEEIERLGRHIEACPTCQGVLESLDGIEDSVVADIRGQAGPLPPNPELEERIRDAQEISRVVWQERPADGPEEPLPARLGQYEIIERIGRGGMGTVYKALHPHLKRIVAVKVLPQERLRDPQAVVRFKREMEAVGRLDHPHLVRAHDAGEADGQHFLVMEYLDGTDLRKLARERGPLPVADACEFIRQAALGLQHAHEHGLVHRDVKPSNLMITSDGTVKVLDLGLARLMDEAIPAGDMTSAGQIVGTADFIAPEQGQDTRNADARSDIYSLGCTLYYLLAGRVPFSGPGYDTFGKKLLAHTREPIPPIQAIRKDVPEAVASIIERMTAKAPAERFQTAAEVAAVLAPLAAGGNQFPIAVGREPNSLEVAKRAGHARTHMRFTWLLPTLTLVISLLIIGTWFGRSLLFKQPTKTDHEFLEYLRHEKEAAQKAVNEKVLPDLRKMGLHLDTTPRSNDEDVEGIKSGSGKSIPVQKEGQP